tara:strand:- start:51 stop:350 length:300 start_codon:yes stop_codon:yes gene_type:complete
MNNSLTNFEKYLRIFFHKHQQSLIVGFNYSINSINIIKALNYFKELGLNIFSMNGKASCSNYNIPNFNAKYFLTIETFLLMLFNELSYYIGGCFQPYNK